MSWESPVGTLAFGLGQKIGDHLPARPKPPAAVATQSGPAAGQVSDRLVIRPVGDADVSWRELLEGLRETPWWERGGGDRYGQFVDVVIPVTLAGGTLSVTAPVHAVGMVAEEVVPVLDQYARENLNGRVVFIDRQTAARRAAA